mmetsp:Transcript_63821/g.168641  ORF Transcript_63821/g.168641 Transcript_63821/m.168641 type:complete len:276 (-) Transcript_63821:25-852(-)
MPKRGEAAPFYRPTLSLRFGLMPGRTNPSEPSCGRRWFRASRQKDCACCAGEPPPPPCGRSTVRVLGGTIGSENGLPLVAILEKLLLVVQQLLVGLCGVLKIGTLDDRVDRARLLAEAAEDALGHVDVVARRATGAVIPDLGLDRDRLGRADGLAQLARDTPLLAGGVAPQRVLSTEAGADGALLVGVVQRHLLLPEHEERELHAADQLGHHQRARRPHQHLVRRGGALVVGHGPSGVEAAVKRVRRRAERAPRARDRRQPRTPREARERPEQHK